MIFTGSALPSFPVIQAGEHTKNNPMSYAKLKAEADAVGAKIRNIIEHIRNATLDQLHAIEEHLGLSHPETKTFHDFDNRLGTIVNQLHNVEPEKLDAVASMVAVPAPAPANAEIPANVIPLTPEVKETGDSVDTNGDVAAPSGASAEVSPTPDQAAS